MPNLSAGQVPATSPVSALPAVVTRLVTGALVLVAGAIVVSAVGIRGDNTPRAQVAADTQAAVLVPHGSPALAQLKSAQRLGDVILLRVDPAGDNGARTLVLSPGATVTTTAGAVSLERLLGVLGDPTQAPAVRAVQFRLSYDSTGQVVALTAAAER